MTFLTNWYLENYDDYNLAWGFVHNSKKFPEGSFIHTSNIKEIKVDEMNRCLIIETLSKSIYTAMFEDMKQDEEFILETETVLKKHGYLDVVEQIKMISKEKEEKVRQELDKELEDGDLYIELNASDIENMYFKYNQTIYAVKQHTHTGMFQDTFIYLIPKIVDFRHYEFGYRRFNTYKISSSIKRIIVNNRSGNEFTIDDTKCKIGKSIITIR